MSSVERPCERSLGKTQSGSGVWSGGATLGDIELSKVSGESLWSVHFWVPDLDRSVDFECGFLLWVLFPGLIDRGHVFPDFLPGNCSYEDGFPFITELNGLCGGVIIQEGLRGGPPGESVHFCTRDG